MIGSLKFSNGVFGVRAVIGSAWSAEVAEALSPHAIAEIELNQAKGWRGNDLSFLALFPDLKALDILDLSIRDVSAIHSLHKPRRLGVTTYCKTEIDFSAFPELESCGLDWGDRRAESLFDCRTLKKLFVNRYRGREFAPFARLVELESLAILNAPIQNLQGIGALGKLRSLRLAALRRLKSLAGMEELASLEELEIHTCRSIGAIDELGFLPRLKKLHLNNDGDIESMKPLDRIDGLQTVGFYESTNILDGDLSPLTRQRNLSRIAFQNRRHYSHRREDFGEAYSGATNVGA